MRESLQRPITILYRMRHLAKIICGFCLVTLAWTVWAEVTGAAEGVGESGRMISQMPSASKVDVNRAAAKELSRLPGMTVQDAERVVLNRPYRKLDDLVTRKILGKKQFAQIKELIVAGKGKP
jgi:DNA uptake protein ComE-like DNA-binding protein